MDNNTLVMTPCEKYPPRMAAICRGESGHSPEAREAYLQIWESQELGRDIPPQVPGLAEKAWNLAGSLFSFVADGCKTVTHEQYRERLQICDTCDQRDDGSCKLCGCNLAIKAHGRAFACPLNKWPFIPTGE